MLVKPDAAWMTTQAESFLARAKANELPTEVVLRDRDCKYTAGFDGALKVGEGEVKAVAYRSPNMNAYVERFVQAIEHECLDRFIVFGREHLNHVCGEYARTTTRSGRTRRGGTSPRCRPIVAPHPMGPLFAGNDWVGCSGITSAMRHEVPPKPVHKRSLVLARRQLAKP